MNYSKRIDSFTQYYYEVKNDEVVAGQYGPGPSGGGAFSCTYDEFVNGGGRSSEVISFITNEFGSDHYEEILEYVKRKIG